MIFLKRLSYSESIINVHQMRWYIHFSRKGDSQVLNLQRKLIHQGTMSDDEI